MVQQQYDALYRLTSVTDGDGLQTVYIYGNAAGYLSSITRGSQVQQFTQYDGNGQLLTYIDPKGNSTSYTYYNDGSLNSVQNPSDSESFDYDPQYGYPTAMTDSLGTVTPTYNGNLYPSGYLRVFNNSNAPGNATVGYQYWPDGQRQSMTTPAGSYNYQYDDRGRLKYISDPVGNTATYGYYGNDLLHTVQYGNGLTTTYTPNAVGETQDINTTLNGNAFSDYGSISYDGMSHELSVTSTVPELPALSGLNTYQHDSQGELTQELSTTGFAVANNFLYDPNGVATVFRNGLPITTAYDVAGNPTNENGVTTTFDAENRLSTATSSAANVAYQYDGSGLVAVTGATSNGSFTPSSYWLYDGDDPVCELGPSGNVQASNTFGATGLVDRNTPSGTAYYTFDDRGNTALRTDTNGNILSSHAFDAYGNELTQNTTGDPYASYGAQYGYRKDYATGFNLLGHRFYDPSAGHFLNQDPIGIDGGLNVYGYAGNDPVDGADPSGLDPQTQGDPNDNDLYNSPIGTRMGSELNNFGTTSPGSMYAPLQDARDTWSGIALNLPVVGELLGGIEGVIGCDFIAGRQLNPVQRILNALPCVGALGKDIGNAEKNCGNVLTCFVAGTKVQTDHGLVPIEQVKVGDLVWSRSEKTGKDELKHVLKTFSPIHLQSVLVSLSNGQQFEATLNHPIAVSGKGFVLAGKLNVGDSIVTRLGGPAKITAIQRKEIDEKTYNLEVEDDHTYFVGDVNGGVWVHNTCRNYLPTVNKVKNRWPINAWRAGTAYNGIPIKLNGYPDFSGVAISTQTVPFTGSYSRDFAAANAGAGLTETPAGFTWHHCEDGQTLQLVPTADHDAVRHTGGVAIWEELNGSYGP